MIESFKRNESGTIEVVFREPSNAMLLSHPPKPAPDKVWKEIYGVVNGKIELVGIEDGMHIPSQYIPSTITFR